MAGEYCRALFVDGAGGFGEWLNKKSKWFHGWLSPDVCGAVDGLDAVGSFGYIEILDASPKVALSLPVFHGLGLWKMTLPIAPGLWALPSDDMNRPSLFNFDGLGFLRRDSEQCRM